MATKTCVIHTKVGISKFKASNLFELVIIFISFKAVRAEFMSQQANQIAHIHNSHLHNVGL